MYLQWNAFLALYITSLAIAGSQASVWNGIPLVSQLKWISLSGDTEAARRQQINFSNQAPVFPLTKCTDGVLSGDLHGARKKQELFIKNHLEPTVDGTPHIKERIHMAVAADSDADEEVDSYIYNKSEKWNDSDADGENNSKTYDKSEGWDDSDIYEESEEGVLRENGRFGSTNEQPQYDADNLSYDEDGQYDEHDLPLQNLWNYENRANNEGSEDDYEAMSMSMED